MSAGFAPVAVGTETDGSIVMPANRASLFAIKPTVGLCSAKGLVPVCKDFDTPGPLAKTAADVGILLDALSGKNTASGGPHETAARTKSWSDIRVGVLDPEIWQQPHVMIKPVPSATEQMVRSINSAYTALKPLVKEFHRNIEVYHVPDVLKMSGTTFQTIFGKFPYLRGPESNELEASALGKELDQWLSSYDTCKVSSLEELIEFNIKHADQELPPGISPFITVVKTLTKFDRQSKPELSRESTVCRDDSSGIRCCAGRCQKDWSSGRHRQSSSEV